MAGPEQTELAALPLTTATKGGAWRCPGRAAGPIDASLTLMWANSLGVESRAEAAGTSLRSDGARGLRTGLRGRGHERCGPGRARSRAPELTRRGGQGVRDRWKVCTGHAADLVEKLDMCLSLIAAGTCPLAVATCCATVSALSRRSRAAATPVGEERLPVSRRPITAARSLLGTQTISDDLLTGRSAVSSREMKCLTQLRADFHAHVHTSQSPPLGSQVALDKHQLAKENTANSVFTALRLAIELVQGLEAACAALSRGGLSGSVPLKRLWATPPPRALHRSTCYYCDRLVPPCLALSIGSGVRLGKEGYSAASTAAFCAPWREPEPSRICETCLVALNASCRTRPGPDGILGGDKGTVDEDSAEAAKACTCKVGRTALD